MFFSRKIPKLVHCHVFELKKYVADVIICLTISRVCYFKIKIKLSSHQQHRGPKFEKSVVEFLMRISVQINNNSYQHFPKMRQ